MEKHEMLTLSVDSNSTFLAARLALVPTSNPPWVYSTENEPASRAVGRATSKIGRSDAIHSDMHCAACLCPCNTTLVPTPTVMKNILVSLPSGSRFSMSKKWTDVVAPGGKLTGVMLWQG